jgi:hypothetical protein
MFVCAAQVVVTVGVKMVVVVVVVWLTKGSLPE